MKTIEKTFRSVAIRATFQMGGAVLIKLAETKAMTQAGRIVYINPNEIVG